MGTAMQTAAELVELARQARNAGRTEEALAFYTAAMAAAHEVGDMAGMMHHGRHVADLHRKLGNFEEAYVLISVTLGFYRENPPSDLELANTLRIAALADEAYEDFGRRAALWLEASELYARVGVQAGMDEAQAHLKRLEVE
jgi:tetratricopeptide (TPR) repeat protein